MFDKAPKHRSQKKFFSWAWRHDMMFSLDTYSTESQQYKKQDNSRKVVNSVSLALLSHCAAGPAWKSSKFLTWKFMLHDISSSDMSQTGLVFLSTQLEKRLLIVCN